MFQLNYKHNLRISLYHTILKNDFLIFCDLGILSKETLYEVKKYMIKKKIKQIFINKSIVKLIFEEKYCNFIQNSTTIFAFSDINDMIFFSKFLEKILTVSFFGKFVNINNLFDSSLTFNKLFMFIFIVFFNMFFFLILYFVFNIIYSKWVT